MGDADVQETRRTQAAGVTCRIVRAAITAHGVRSRRETVGGGRTAGSSADRAPLRVIEDVERLGSEFKVHALLDREVLIKSHVEVPVSGVA